MLMIHSSPTGGTLRTTGERSCQPQELHKQNQQPLVEQWDNNYSSLQHVHKYLLIAIGMIAQLI